MYDTTEQGSYFRLKRNPELPALVSFLRNISAFSSPQKHASAQTHSPLEASITKHRRRLGVEVPPQKAPGREGKRSAQPCSVSESGNSPPALRLTLLHSVLRMGCQSVPLALRSGSTESHWEQFMGLNNLCYCKLDLVSAFLDCKTNAYIELKMPAYLDRFANRHVQLEHFYWNYVCL